MRDRHTWSGEDRALQQEIEESTKVSNNLFGVIEALQTGNAAAAKGNVPNYGTGKGQWYAHEQGGESLDLQTMFVTSQNILGEEKTSEIAGTVQPTGNQPMKKQAGQNLSLPSKPAYKVSQNQWSAIKKFPNLIEFLGTEHADRVVSKIMAEINNIVAEQVEKNSQIVNDFAKQCVAQKQNLHQFFQGPGWVCQVTANGPFTGKEAIFYHDEKDKSFILRNSGGTKYEDVSSQFNIIHEFKTIEEDGIDINNLEVED